jgi:hypothetical protein
MSTEVFIVGQFVEDTWKLVGVFDEYENAFKQCKDSSYFMGPIKKNTVFSKEDTTPKK